MNEFYSIATIAGSLENPLQLDNLGNQKVLAIVGKSRRNSDFWGGDSDYGYERNNRSQTFYASTTPEDYDQQFVSRIANTKPPYEIGNFIDYHFNFYVSNRKGDPKKYYQHLKYVILPILEKRKNTKVYCELVTEWLTKQESQLSNRMSGHNLEPKVNDDEYFPLELLNNTRQYLVSIATQAVGCYKHRLYDACFIMSRKLLEALLLELFERHKLSDKIKDKQTGNFFYLSMLIDSFKSETTWNVSRNTKTSLPNLKKMGDLRTHNRRYIARKGDVDELKNDFRVVLEELVHLIDFPTWKR